MLSCRMNYRRISRSLLAAVIAIAAAACGSDSSGEPAADAMRCDTGICGMVSYTGAYDGPDAPIYIRVYKESGSASINPVAAVGDPDFFATRTGPGAYQVDLAGYTGTVYISAFMDVDGSGQIDGPNARATIEHGLYSDPLGAHGGFTFEGTADTEPAAVEATAAGVAGIDIQLTDSGVISGTISGSGTGGAAVVAGAFVPELNGKFLHHAHQAGYSDGMTYLVPLPPGDHWHIRSTVGNAPAFYPQNPPPPPPSNTTPVTVTANTVTTGIDMTLN